MSTLTKICIVLVFVLSLVSCVVFYQKAVTDTDWKTAFENQRTRANLAETDARYRELVIGNWQRLNETKDAKIADLQERLRVAIENKDGEIARLMGRLAEQKSQTQDLITQVERLNSTVALEIRLHKDSSAKVDRLRVEMIALEDKLRNAQHQLTENATQIEGLTKRQRANEEKIAGLEEQNDHLATTKEKLRDMLKDAIAQGYPVGDIEALTGAAPVPKEKIEGSVIGVLPRMASLNVGSKDKVEKGMVFWIYRSEGFVGQLRVQDVGADDCAGEVFDNVRDVQVGDKASTEPP